MHITRPTFNHILQQRNLLSTSKHSLGGGKDSKLINFVPPNPFQAKRSIERKDFGLYQDRFDLKHHAELKDYLESKSKRIEGDFLPSYTNDKLKTEIKRISQSQFRTSDSRVSRGGLKAMNETSYSTFLKEKEDLPRLSILTNYQQIMRIMTKNFMRSPDLQKRFSTNDHSHHGHQSSTDGDD